jgi:hypothetical protein
LLQRSIFFRARRILYICQPKNLYLADIKQKKTAPKSGLSLIGRKRPRKKKNTNRLDNQLVLQCNIWSPPPRGKKKMLFFNIFFEFTGKVKKRTRHLKCSAQKSGIYPEIGTKIAQNPACAYEPPSPPLSLGS